MYDSSGIRDALYIIYGNLTSNIEDFQQRGSGWVLGKLLALDLHLLEFDPLRATSYIPLPACIQNRKAVINIRNNDEKYFLWSVIAVLYFKDVQLHNLQRPSHYLEYEKGFNLQGISFPMALKDIPKFEKANNVSVSVYGYQEGTEDKEGFIYPLKVSKEVNVCHVDLPMMVQTSIVSSRTLVSWCDRSIRVIPITRNSLDSVCMDSRGILHLEVKIDSFEGRIKK